MNTTGPDFSSITKELVTLPYRKEPYSQFTFSDPVLEGYKVILIEDSTAPETSDRLVTFIVRFPRSILAEMNTHRVFSRNSASSRARSVRSAIMDVITDPFVPLFTVNQKGMSGGFLTGEKLTEAKKVWLEARDSAVASELKLLLGTLYDPMKSPGQMLDDYYENVYKATPDSTPALSIHKQDANRVIEPFMWNEVILASSYWDNFLNLRTDISAAAPSIVATSKLIEAALSDSKTIERWAHIPFVDKETLENVTGDLELDRETLMLSSTEAAQVSYKDKSSMRKSTATTSLGEKLLSMEHLSPFEHS